MTLILATALLYNITFLNLENNTLVIMNQDSLTYEECEAKVVVYTKRYKGEWH